MKQVIVDYRADRESIDALKAAGLEVVRSMKISSLYSEVDGHPDMQLHIANGKAICAPEAFFYYSEILKIKTIKGSINIGSSYPNDICYNACSIGGCVLCFSRHTAPEILSEYKTVIDTRQGYSKCSVCVVGKDAAITADEGIYKTLTACGIDVLKISPGFIELYGMGGFIGGASGMISKDHIAFNGELSTHPDCENIRSFCREHGIYITELRKGTLRDIGTIMLVP